MGQCSRSPSATRTCRPERAQKGAVLFQSWRQVDVDGRSLFAAYTAKYAPKFSDAFREELLNDDADANSVAASVLSRYHPCVPEMALHMFGSVFRQYHVTTASRGKRDFLVPLPDAKVLPKAVLLYMSSSWRSAEMNLLDFLRKSNDEGAIAGWLRRKWENAGTSASLEAFANDYRVDGEKIVACAMRSRLSDAYYGQWLLLNVPFRRVADLLLPDTVLAKVPETDKYLAMCLTCPHSAAKAMFDDLEAWNEDMLFEGRALVYRRTVLDYIATQAHLVRHYLAGRLELPSRMSGEAEGQPRRVHRFPIQRHYEQAIQAGSKTVEGRLYANVAADVRQGDHVQLGRTIMRVRDLAVYETFEDMLQDVGYANAVPDAISLEDAAETYLAFPRYRELERQCGVVAFWLAEPAPQEEPTLNQEQQRWLAFIEEDMERAAAVHDAATEGDMDEAREQSYYGNKIRVLEGPPGTGKTTTAVAAVQRALDRGLPVLWATYTAQLASRARQRLGDAVETDTCHAAFGLDLDLTECALNLASYGLVIVDEFSQLRAADLEHVDKLYKAVDHACAFGLLGDRFQAAGFGDERVWHSHAWRRTHRTELHQLYRCKDPDFGRMLGILRTSKPTATGAHGSLTVAKIMKHRRAWRGHTPNVEDVGRLLRRHPGTTFMAITRRGAQQLNQLAVEALFGDQTPAATIQGDVESNPENYAEDGRLKDLKRLKPLELTCYPGMQAGPPARSLRPAL